MSVTIIYHGTNLCKNPFKKKILEIRSKVFPSLVMGITKKFCVQGAQICNTTQNQWPTNKTVSCIQTSELLTFWKGFLEAFPVDVSQDMIWLPVEMPQGQFTEELIAWKQNEDYWKYALRAFQSIFICSHKVTLFKKQGSPYGCFVLGTMCGSYWL